MKKISLFAVLFFLVAFTASQATQVTFRCNTSTVPDTMCSDNSVVQIRGDDGVAGGLEWDGTSELFMTKRTCDYYELTWDFAPGTHLYYKYYTNASHDTVFGGAGWEHQGWEADLNPNGNRELDVGNDPILLDLEFVNGVQNWIDPEDIKPWDDEPGSFVFYIRTNLQGMVDFFDLDDVQVGVRGSNTDDWGQTGEINWNCTYWLTRESNHANQGSRQYNGEFFFSGPVHVPDQYAGKGIQFKVVVHQAGADPCEPWDNMVWNPSKEDNIPISGNDTTNCWFWYDNIRPIRPDHEDTVVVTWSADMSKAIANNGFTVGETLEVQSGFYATAMEVRTKMMLRQGFTNFYEATDTIVTSVGEYLDYQYYKITGGTDYREIFYNFAYDGENVGEAERRVVDPVTSPLLVEDIVDSDVDLHRMPLFRNTNIVSQPVTVCYTVDVRSAICAIASGKVLHDIQGTVHVGDPDSVIILGVAMNGPATGGWDNPIGSDWGPHLMTLAEKAMHDDGLDGDLVAGDSIYTLCISYHPDSNDVVGQEFKFGIGGGDNEGGYGNNHVENIDDTQAQSYLASQFGSIAPPQYVPWNFDLLTCCEKGDVNCDGVINVVDALGVVNEILRPCHLPPLGKYLADCKEDDDINVLDVLSVVRIILLEIPNCAAAAECAQLTPGVEEFLKSSVRPHLSAEQFAELMALVKAEFGIPFEYRLSQNYPNPFNPETSIEYALPEQADVKLSVYNVLGQQVKLLVDGRMEAGFHTVTFDGSDFSSGVYFYRLEADNTVMTKKMVLMK